MYELMDGQIDGRVDKWVDEQTVGRCMHVYGYMDRHMNVWLSGCINRYMDSWIYVCLDRLVNKLARAWLPGRRVGYIQWLDMFY